MKKLLVVLAAGLLVFGVAGQAKAAFSTGDLVRVMYDASTGVEVATDMGSVSSLASSTNNTAFDVISLSTFGTTATWSQVNTAYFAITTGSPLVDFIAGTATPTAQLIVGGGTGVNGTIGSILSNYSSLSAIAGDPNSVSVATTAQNTYYNNLNAGGAKTATYNGNIVVGTMSNTEVNNAIGGTQLLYSFTGPFPTGRGGTVSNGVLVAAAIPTGFTIVTDVNGVNGASEINPAGSAAPIPPSILLMGSGLLGLIGVGRRKIFG
ncbi:MAG: hypothetical protein ACLP2X_02470 [Syntrophobacteraceae bacterium]